MRHGTEYALTVITPYLALHSQHMDLEFITSVTFVEQSHTLLAEANRRFVATNAGCHRHVVESVTSEAPNISDGTTYVIDE